MLDDLRAAVAGSGSVGVVARFPGVLAVATGDEAAVRRLLDLCAEAAGDAPGTALARRFAVWLAGPDAPAADFRFGTIAAAGERWAVFLLGAVGLHDGRDAVRGVDAAAWVDRLIDPTDGPLVLSLEDASGGAESGPEALGSLLDLRAGVVRGTSVTVGAQAAAAPEPREAHTVAMASLPGVPAPPAPAEASALQPPRRAERIDGSAPPERRPPLAGGGGGRPETGGTPPAGRSAPDELPQARGHLCARGHLNDPRSHFCVLCGIRMDERTGILVKGPRPPLGLLVFDDGATYTVDAEYLVGRAPDVDERVQDGSLRAIVLNGAWGSISRVHAEVRVDGWDVMLLDRSSNGTHVAEPGTQSWTTLAPRVPHRLVPGTRVRMGERTFLFESPSGVR